MENQNNNTLVTKEQLMFPQIAMWVIFAIYLISFFVYITKLSTLDIIFNITLNLLFLVVAILVTLSIRNKFYYYYFISIILSIIYGVINTIMEIINIVQLKNEGEGEVNNYIYSLVRSVVYLFIGWAMTILLFGYRSKVYIFCNTSIGENEDNL